MGRGAKHTVVGFLLMTLLAPALAQAGTTTTIPTSLRVPRPLFTAGKPGPQYKAIIFGFLRATDVRCREGQIVEVTVNGQRKADMTDAEGAFFVIFKLRGFPRDANTRYAGATVATDYDGTVTCGPSQGPTKKVHPPGKKGRQSVGR